MLLLPTGQVLLGKCQSGGPVGLDQSAVRLHAQWFAPSGVAADDHERRGQWRQHYTLTGTQLNGLSAGASHGTSTEMATNYPIVELHG